MSSVHVESINVRCQHEGPCTCQQKAEAWSIVRELSFPQRAKLLAFCTGSPSPPAVGFSRLPGFNGGVAQFTMVGTGSSGEHLPSASTCFAKLKLPAYKSLDILRSKLSQAIELAEGFAETAVAHA